MPDVDSVCDYSIELNSLLDGASYVNQSNVHIITELLSTGVWSCPHDSLPNSSLCVFHTPVKEIPREINETNYLLQSLYKSDNNESNAFIYRTFIGARFGDLKLKNIEFEADDDFPILFAFCTFNGEVEVISEFVQHTLFVGSKFKQNADFSGSVFRSDIDFDGVEFQSGSDFSDSIFKDAARFVGTTFSGDASFRKSEFHSDCRFITASFESSCRFTSSSFHNRALFQSATFDSIADFSGSTFKSEVMFTQAKFNGTCRFIGGLSGPESIASELNSEDVDPTQELLSESGLDIPQLLSNSEQTTFHDSFIFNNVKCREGIKLSAENKGKSISVDINSESNFSNSDLSNSDFNGIDFSNSYFTGSNLINTVFTNCDLTGGLFEDAIFSRSKFMKTDLRGAKLSGAILGDVQIDEDTKFLGQPSDDSDSSPHTFSAISSRPTCVYDPDYEESNEHEDVDKAKSVYRALEELGGKHARPRLQARSFVRRQDLQKQDYWDDATADDASLEERVIAGARWSRARVARATLLYGESPWRVIAWSLGIIFSFALLYPLGGWMKPKDGDPITYAQIGANPIEFFNSVYYSTLTYTALGFGDFQPVGFGRLLTSVETGLGAVMLALLVFILGRRAAR